VNKPLAALLALAAAPLIATLGSAAPTAPGAADADFASDARAWRVVVDGVMGGLSTGRVTQAESGALRFSGTLSLENNGGFSQIRRAVSGDQFDGAEGIEITVRGDRRVYSLDIRTSNARLMAGGFQREFLADAGEWQTLRIPFGEFTLYNFGRKVASPPALDPSLIESIGVTLGDKKSGPFAIELAAISTYGNESASPVPGGTDLVSVASAAGLNTLLALVEAADLQLPSGEQVTIFAPTDDAFAALPKETVTALLAPEGRDQLRSILTYHVAGSAISSADLLSRSGVNTLNGQRLSVGTDGTVSVGGGNVIAVDVPFDGGIVHVIDRVLMPELKTLAELAASTSELSTLAAAFGAAGLGDAIGPDNGPFTVFAPTDSAFAQLPADALEELLQTENREMLVQILGLHVVPGRLYANELLATGRAESYFGDTLSFSVENGRLRVGESNVIASNIEASNGLVHLIDSVLLPTTPAAPSADRVARSATLEAARLFDLAIERGVPLFNAGQHAACAAIYEMTIESMVALGSDLDARMIERLERALADARRQNSWGDRAWTYREAMDEVYAHVIREMRAGGFDA
jgi:uncharacterized surface protein with fasciclin (FAS1) repeats